MTVSTEKKTGTTSGVEDARPPARSRAGSWGVWVGVAVTALMALALFGFAADGDTDAAADDPDGEEVILVDDPGNDLGN